MIEVRNLTKAYGETRAVDSISFKIDGGEIGCLIGTSGCGKTTTLKMINRLVEPTEGEIRVGDEDGTDSDPITWRRGIGYVVQKAGLLPHMTVGQNISLLSRILKRKRAFIDGRVRELMEMVNMPYGEFVDRYPAELSGGQQGRVGIARALMEDPPVLLMDEPFGALDAITRSSIHDELIYLNEKLKKTVLLVTHDLDEAFKLGDRILLMDKGVIVQSDTKKDFLANPKNRFVEEFIQGRSK